MLGLDAAGKTSKSPWSSWVGSSFLPLLRCPNMRTHKAGNDLYHEKMVCWRIRIGRHVEGWDGEASGNRTTGRPYHSPHYQASSLGRVGWLGDQILDCELSLCLELNFQAQCPSCEE